MDEQLSEKEGPVAPEGIPPACVPFYRDHAEAIAKAVEVANKAAIMMDGLEKRYGDNQRNICGKLDELKEALETALKRLGDGDTAMALAKRDFEELKKDFENVAEEFHQCKGNHGDCPSIKTLKKEFEEYVANHNQRMKEDEERRIKEAAEKRRFWDENLTGPVVKYFALGLLFLVLLGIQSWMQQQTMKDAVKAAVDGVKSELTPKTGK